MCAWRVKRVPPVKCTVTRKSHSCKNQIFFHRDTWMTRAEVSSGLSTTPGRNMKHIPRTVLCLEEAGHKTLVLLSSSKVSEIASHGVSRGRFSSNGGQRPLTLANLCYLPFQICFPSLQVSLRKRTKTQPFLSFLSLGYESLLPALCISANVS